LASELCCVELNRHSIKWVYIRLLYSHSWRKLPYCALHGV